MAVDIRQRARVSASNDISVSAKQCIITNRVNSTDSSDESLEEEAKEIIMRNVFFGANDIEDLEFLPKQELLEHFRREEATRSFNKSRRKTSLFKLIPCF